MSSYQRLSSQEDFKLCINDMLERTGIPQDSLDDMQNQEVYDEFAKCFVPYAIDKINNYELYEIVGDSTLNKCMISYLSNILFPLIRSKDSSKSVGYMAVLKSYYVSKHFYAPLSEQLGFDEFVKRVCLFNEASIDAYFSGKSKGYKDLYEDAIEAFIGCLETQIDRYVGMHRGYVYVANFIYDLLSNVEIDFSPDKLLPKVSILKEANDRIRQKGLTNYNVIYKNGEAYSQPAIQDVNRRTITVRGEKKMAEEEMSSIVIDYLNSLQEYKGMVKGAPTPEELGIASLIRKKS